MGKKYIIELEDKPFHNGNGDFLYRVKGFNSLVFDMTGVGKLTRYTEPDLEQIKRDYDDWYEKGLADAWEVARKIQDTGGNLNWWIHNTSASEAIEKIRQYEQGKDEQIQVGDEVRNIQHGWTAVVSAIDRECMTLMDTNGKLGDGYDMNRFIKTGRHFPEIAAVLEKMRDNE